MGFDVRADLLLKMQLATAHRPIAFAALANEKHLHATEPDLHVGNLLGHYLLRFVWKMSSTVSRAKKYFRRR